MAPLYLIDWFSPNREFSPYIDLKYYVTPRFTTFVSSFFVSIFKLSPVLSKYWNIILRQEKLRVRVSSTAIMAKPFFVGETQSPAVVFRGCLTLKILKIPFLYI